MFIPIIIPFQQYPRYVKRTELDSFLQKYTKGTRMGFIVVIVAGLFVQAVMGFLVLPKVSELSTTLNQTQAPYIIPLILISAGLGLVLLPIAVMSNPLDMNKVEKIKQDKDEMVTINGPLNNRKIASIFWGYLVLSFLVIVVTIILPINGLTSSLTK